MTGLISSTWKWALEIFFDVAEHFYDTLRLAALPTAEWSSS